MNNDDIVMSVHGPIFRFTAKEVNILVQALEIAKETGDIYAHGKASDVERLREKLNGGGVK